MKTYACELVRRFDATALINPTPAELLRGEEDGLAGNQHYRDLTGFDWEDVADALDLEAMLIERFGAAADLETQSDQFEDQRAETFDDADALWGLDVGVAAATLALSALGAIPVTSCNAGGFGGLHVAAFPYAAFYIGTAEPTAILALVVEADVGLDVVEPGIGRLFGRTDLDLHRFARVALGASRAS